MEAILERRGAESAGPAACGHGDLEFVGAGGNASYYRCESCGVVLIDQGGRLWTIRRHVPVAG